MEVEPYPLNWTYTANYSSNVLVDYLFSFEYHWDDVANQSRLTSFHMLGDIFLIVVDPDWDLFNQGLANIGDLDRIIDTVTYNSTTLNITFGDFLDSVPSYQFTRIQGFPGSSISPSTTHEWKFEFNLGNVIYQREYDPVFFEWIFTPYSNYNASTIIQFTEGGTLIESTYFDEKIVEEVDEEPLRLESVISYYNKDLRTSNTSISFNSILVTIIAIPLSIFGLKRKKK